ncbi:alcohol dehydrogenase [Moniliophthora roreri]|nr:alcohol dehydrogenase [Moniliophthora roreri]
MPGQIPETCRQYQLPRTVPVPKPKSTEVLIKVKAASINFRDLVIANGGSPLPTKPDVIPLSDMAGEVVAVGDSVARFKEGDRVSANAMLDHISGPPTPQTKNSCLAGEIDGVLTEYRVFPEHSLVHVPEHLSYEEGSTLACAGVTAYNALTGSKPLKEGQSVLVMGTSGVSLFAIQLAAASGATVIATSSSDEKLELAQKLGAKYGINYVKNEAWEAEALKLTNGVGVDHVVELGGPGTWMKSLAALKYDGEMHAVSAQGKFEDVSGTIIGVLIQKALHIHGVQIGSRVQFEEMNRLISNASLRPVIDRVFEFEQAKEAYEYCARQKFAGKVVIRVAQ